MLLMAWQRRALGRLLSAVADLEEALRCARACSMQGFRLSECCLPHAAHICRHPHMRQKCIWRCDAYAPSTQQHQMYEFACL